MNGTPEKGQILTVVDHGRQVSPDPGEWVGLHAVSVDRAGGDYGRVSQSDPRRGGEQVCP